MAHHAPRAASRPSPWSLSVARVRRSTEKPEAFLLHSRSQTRSSQLRRENIKDHHALLSKAQLPLKTGPQSPVGGKQGWRLGWPQAAGSQRSPGEVPAGRQPSPQTVLPAQRGQPGGLTKPSVGGKVTAHFSSNEPVRGSHLNTRCSKQMAREGERLLENRSRARPGAPAARPASAPEARAGLQPGAQLPGEASKGPPTLLQRGAQTEAGRASGLLCPRKRFLFLLWMVLWNRPDCICCLIQKVSVNVIHLQINFSASGWVSNKREPPCGVWAAQPAAWVRVLTLAPRPVLTVTQATLGPWGSPSEGKSGQKGGRLCQGELPGEQRVFDASSPQMRGRAHRPGLERRRGPLCSCLGPLLLQQAHSPRKHAAHTPSQAPDTSLRTRFGCFTY